MFSQVSVCPQGGVHAGGACMVGACMAGGMHGRGHAWQGVCMTGGMHGRGHAWKRGACMVGGHVWQGACVAEGACMVGGHAWQERRPLQQAVRILLECIIIFINVFYNNWYDNNFFPYKFNLIGQILAKFSFTKNQTVLDGLRHNINSLLQFLVFPVNSDIYLVPLYYTDNYLNRTASDFCWHSNSVCNLDLLPFMCTGDLFLRHKTSDICQSVTAVWVVSILIGGGDFLVVHCR